MLQIPAPHINALELPHWKVGDGMDLPEGRFIIGNIALVKVSASEYEVRFFDKTGRHKGRVGPLYLTEPIKEDNHA